MNPEGLEYIYKSTLVAGRDTQRKYIKYKLTSHGFNEKGGHFPT
jgi:hypothetical protein